jgi:hypothetical protein
MELKRSKNPDVCFVFTKAYLRVRGYGDEGQIPYTKILEAAKNYPEPMHSEMVEIYNKRFPLTECAICGKTYNRMNASVTCSPACSWEYKRAYMNKRNNAEVECDCTVCGKTFIKKRHQQKYVCSPECAKEFGKAHDGKIDRTKKKHKSQVGKIEKDARKRGLHYADIQKQKTLELVGGVEI